ncbi:MAG TPA: glycoside hydrolase family 5 protein, partial [Verrucomicrobia bacterium]|nr:glycoside hydrolase family 5 protein [Verrucomicrobiota bacterium]
PRLAEESGILKELKESLEALGEFLPDEGENGEFRPMAYTHDAYIAKLNAELKMRAPAEKYAAYLEVFEREPPVFAAKQMDQILRKRFGDKGAEGVWDAFHDSWITERDFQLARAHGFNFIRLPFWYRWFESNDSPYQYHDYGFRYLNKAIGWAEKHHLYVMLDLHGAVGGQSPWDHSGSMSEIEFFKNMEFQKRTAALWKEIARRYKGNPVVWAYDLLNEPFSASDTKNWAEAHDMLYDAIRAEDPDTIVIMEDGYKLEFPKWTKTGFFPDPTRMGWEKLIYSLHFYSGPDPLFSDERGLADHDKRSAEVLRLARLVQDRHNVPIYFGEFSTMGNHANDIEGMRVFLSMFNEHGLHWSPWTWKYVDDDNEGTIWGLYQYAKEWPEIPNFHRDSLESILKVIARFNMDDFVLQEPYANVLNRCLAQPVKSAVR